MNRSALHLILLNAALSLCSVYSEDRAISGLPDYDWYAGCFGTASGNLMGYWDRTGFPNFYTGPTANGVAPLDSFTENQGIRSMWASKAGFDGRPADQPGHADDYWTYLIDGQSYSYESTAPDPYLAAGRAEHAPDSLCDFMGASQNKWGDLNGECAGNIDAFAFNYWDHSGAMRTNFVPPASDGIPTRDVQSGLRAWTQYRGYDATVASQLVEFNPNVPLGQGFTFDDLKAEILRGYPVLLMLQDPNEFSRDFSDMRHANPHIHAMVAFHYKITDQGDRLVQFRTSWASGEANESWAVWGPQIWAAEMPLRGVILYHPLPKITALERGQGKITIRWDGPASTLWDDESQSASAADSYILERANSLDEEFLPVGDPTSDREMTVEDTGTSSVFFRVLLGTPAYDATVSAGRN